MNNSWTTRCSFLLVALLFACESSQGVCNASSVRVTPVRGFNVSVRLSELATKKLADRRETIVVFGYVYGGPKAGAPESLVSDMGEIGLGDFRTEISPRKRDIRGTEAEGQISRTDCRFTQVAH